MDVLVLFKDRMVTNCLIQFAGYKYSIAHRAWQAKYHFAFRACSRSFRVRLIDFSGYLLYAIGVRITRTAMMRQSGFLRTHVSLPFFRIGAGRWQLPAQQFLHPDQFPIWSENSGTPLGDGVPEFF